MSSRGIYDDDDDGVHYRRGQQPDQETTDRASSSDDRDDYGDHRALLSRGDREYRGPKDESYFGSTVLINFVNLMMWAATLMIPAVYADLQEDFNLGPRHLGVVPMVRSMVQYLLAPIFGYCADTYSRRRLFTLGVLWWGISTLFIAAATNFAELVVAMAFNGFGLAVVIPVSYSLLADYYDQSDRGKAFGWLGFASVVGAMFGVVFPTAMAQTNIGMRPWRFCTYVTGGLIIILSLCILAMLRNPPRRDTVGVSWSHVRRILTNKTFLLVVLQGVFGSLSWDVFSFLILWFQCMGLSAWEAAAVFGTCCAGAALGGLFGGYAGDWAAKWEPTRGRIMVAQISVFLGIPFAVVFFGVIPQEKDWIWLYTIIGFLFGYCISWPASACNLPIISEVVPHSALGTAYAVDRMIEGGAAAIGSLLVGVVAKAYGYEGGDHCAADARPEEKSQQAKSLSVSLLLIMTVPWSICFLVYFFLYWTYTKDRATHLPRVKYDPHLDDDEQRR